MSKNPLGAKATVARGRAVNALIEKHQDEYDQLLNVERKAQGLDSVDELKARAHAKSIAGRAEKLLAQMTPAERAALLMSMPRSA